MPERPAVKAAPVTFHELFNQREWKPIRNCPGRFVLVTQDTRVSLDTLLGGNCQAHAFTPEAARDTVLVVPLEDGGLISYARQDGSLVHTLNTPSGFARKLEQLRIALEAE